VIHVFRLAQSAIAAAGALAALAGVAGAEALRPDRVPVEGETPGRTRPYPLAMCSNGNVLTNPEYAVKMLESGARICRTDLAFGTIRPRPGDDPATWDWSAPERVKKLRGEHPRLEWLGLLGYGTAWAAEPGGGSGIAAPQRGVRVMPPDDPRNLYGHYVYETVRRYKDVISAWESWNEPDLSGHAFFNGNGADFFHYQKACYLAAKKADPGCTVLFASMCFPTFEGYLASRRLKPPTPYPSRSCFFEEYLRECAKDPDAKRHNHYFDVMNTHTYSRATDAYDYVAVLRRLMKEYTGRDDKPVWITEMGITDTGGQFGCSPDEYCDYILQSYAWGCLAGVERFFHFQLDNSNGHGLYTGMLGQPKPALAAYRDVLARELATARLARQLHGSAGAGFLEGGSPFEGGGRDGWDAFEFRRDDGARIVMAFADTAETVTARIPATCAAAELVDRHGRRKELRAEKGAYEIVLAGATNVAGWPTSADPKAKALGRPEHLVGGATVLIVERPSGRDAGAAVSREPNVGSSRR